MKRKLRLGALAVAALMVLTPVWALGASEPVAARVQRIADEYGVTVDVDELPEVWSGAGLRADYETADAALLSQLDTVEGVLSRYPAGYFPSMKLRRVSLVKSMYSFLDYGAEGYTIGITTKDKEGGTYIIMRSDATALDYHHEVSHLMDMFNLVDDYKWSQLNTPGFDYTGRFVDGDVLPPGIVSSYAIWSPREDRAEVFSFVMDDEGFETLKELCAHDAVLRNKLVMIKAHVKKTIKSPEIVARIDEALAVGAAQPLYYATFGAAGRTGPGEHYPIVNVSGSVPRGVVQQGEKYVKVLIDGAGVYFPTGSMSPAEAPEGDVVVPEGGAGQQEARNVIYDTQPDSAA